MSWRLSDKIICLQYKQYSCGKFLSNILSYNQYFLPQFNLNTETSLIEYSDIHYKNDIISGTIPEYNNLKQWRHYELGCDKFYGIKLCEEATLKKLIHDATNTVNSHMLNKLISEIKPKVKEILENDKHYIFIVSHHKVCTKLIRLIFPNALLVKLVNDELVNEISRNMKSDGKFIDANFDNYSYEFDIGTMFIKDKFFKEVESFLSYLKLDDTKLDSKVYGYYEEYIGLYQPYLNKQT